MTPIETQRGAAGHHRDAPQIDRLGGAIAINNAHFLEKTSLRPRKWWAREAEANGSDWPGVIELALEIIRTTMLESSFERACHLAEQQARRDAPKPPAPRPTPQTTIEAVWYCIRERGIAALKEPANHRRLQTFDAAARAELNRRIERLNREAAHA
jgi:hypothetical protein